MAEKSITLIGVNHSVDNNARYKPNTYWNVYRQLKKLKPGYLTEDLPLFRDQSFDIAEGLFGSDIEGLDGHEAHAIVSPRYQDAWTAGIIYARRNGVPLHFISPWTATENEIVDADLTTYPSVFRRMDRITDRRPLEDEEELPLTDTAKVSEYMAKILNRLAALHPEKSGVHITHIRHLDPNQGIPIQDHIKSRRVHIVDLTRSNILDKLVSRLEAAGHLLQRLD